MTQSETSAGIPAAVDPDPELDTLLRCPVCGRERRARFTDHIWTGWPACPASQHGTMAIVDVDPAVIEQAIHDRLAPISEAISHATRLLDPDA